MQVLDWRPIGERLITGGLRAIPPLTLPASVIADMLVRWRVARRPAPAFGVLVVSVGNLRVGGTGKTPIVLAIARCLHERGHRGAVLLRGYGSRHRAPLLVRPDDCRASDEARLLAAGLRSSGWSVLQSRNRVSGMACLLESKPRPSIVLLDDGYQTAGIGRHLDVLILDSWIVKDGLLAAATGAVLPFGPYRETAAGAGRAHVWLVEDESLPSRLCAKQSPAAPQIFGFSRRHYLTTSDREGAIGEHRYGILSGLARPELFESAAHNLLPHKPILTVRCRDHSGYGKRTVDKLRAVGHRYDITAWVTTEKDWTKLKTRWPENLPVYLVRQEVIWPGGTTLPDMIEERLARSI